VSINAYGSYWPNIFALFFLVCYGVICKQSL
jgi:hypothetical protein